LSILNLNLNGENIRAYAENLTIFETSDEHTVTKGVSYKRIRQVTQAGLRDIFVLTVDLTDPNIVLGPAESQKEYSLKEPLTALLSDNNAIAGVNGDFFGMAGTRSASFGPVIKNGGLVSVNSAINAGDSEYASFFISKFNNPFITFIKASVSFYNNGVRNIDIHSVNKITDMVRPVIVTRAAMPNTESIDARFDDLYKISVENDKITYISGKGETVSVPENGFLVVMNAKTADDCLFNFSVGDRGIMQTSAWVDLNNMQMAIGGGGRILNEGKLSDEGNVAAGRQPRTALGITKDKKNIILVAVDGRSHSVGATHEEMAEIMLKLGAYDAMHLDGGGSTTMAVQLVGETELRTVNTLSDGAQRRVINGLGVYNNAPFGDIARLVVTAGEKNIVYAKTGTHLDIYGTDEYFRRIPLDRKNVILTANDPNGFFAGDLYFPQSLGEITMTAEYGDFTAQTKLLCRELKELRPNVSKIKAMEGDIVRLSFTGIDQTGEENEISSPMSFNVVPAGAGVVENNFFYPKMNTDGYIECTLGGVSCYIPFQIGGNLSLIEPFEGGRNLSFVSSDGVSGRAAYVNSPISTGNRSAELSYLMPPSDETQAAYLVLGEGIELDGEPMAIRMQVYGDMGGLWLRGRITDANGDFHAIDFAGEINWDGWKTVYAMLPVGTEYPIKFDRIYAACLQTETALEGSLYFGSIEAVYPKDEANILLPASSKFKDPLQVDLSASISERSYDITVLGRTLPYDVKPSNQTQYMNRITDIITKNTKRSLYLGPTELPLDIGVSVYKWNENYAHHFDENVTILQMCASGGSITGANPWQWARFREDIKASTKKNVIIMLDKDPLNLAAPQETQLFCDELAALSEQLKLNIFVVSAEGQQTASQIIQGVRYINLGSLWNEDGSLNGDFRILRFRVSGNEVRFELREPEN